MTLDSDRSRRLAWLADSLLPHEAEVRSWLRRRMPGVADIDDVLQEAYCRAWAVSEPALIRNPRSYLFQTVRNILVDQMRRAQVVQIASLADIEALPNADDLDSPERIVTGRMDLRRVEALIGALPERCRRIVLLRKIEGLSQKEIAARLNVTESVVENELVRGLRLVLQDFADGDVEGHPQSRSKRTKVGGRKRHS